MGVYICETCGCLENTAAGGYWKNRRNHDPLQCSACNTGKWHGLFPKKSWQEYGYEELLLLEAHQDGSMLNATDFFKKGGLTMVNNYILLVERYGRSSSENCETGRYRVGAKTQKEAVRFLRDISQLPTT